MPPLSKLISRALTFVRLLENPAQMKLYRTGGMVPVYAAFDKPWFRALHIQTVLDIGANDGRFALALAALLPNACIYAFEPLPEAYQRLRQTAQRHPTQLRAIHCALGDRDGEADFLHYSFEGSSSFLRPSEMFLRTTPEHCQTEQMKVSSRRLDGLVEAGEIGIRLPLLAKLDVQGFEDQVLLGGVNTLSQASVILIESFFQAQYVSQAMFADVYARLTAWGFRYSGSIDQHSTDNGLPAWEDALFIKGT